MFNPLLQSSKIGLNRFTASQLLKQSNIVANLTKFRNFCQLNVKRTNMNLLIGSTSSIILFSMLNRGSSSAILNESVLSPANQLNSSVNSNIKQIDSTIRTKSRFNGRLNYEELAIGSITGLFLGVIAGKLSSVIVFLTLSGYFLTQFLRSRGIITIPWKKIVNVGSESIDLNQLIFDNPSFKISFTASFLIAAYNI